MLSLNHGQFKNSVFYVISLLSSLSGNRFKVYCKNTSGKILSPYITSLAVFILFVFVELNYCNTVINIIKNTFLSLFSSQSKLKIALMSVLLIQMLFQSQQKLKKVFHCIFSINSSIFCKLYSDFLRIT